MSASKVQLLAILAIATGLALVVVGSTVLLAFRSGARRSGALPFDDRLQLTYFDGTVGPAADETVGATLAGLALNLGRDALAAAVERAASEHRVAVAASTTVELGGIQASGLRPTMRSGGVFVVVRTVDAEPDASRRATAGLDTLAEVFDDVVDDIETALRGIATDLGDERLEEAFPPKAERASRVLTFCAVGFVRPRPSGGACEMGLVRYRYPVTAARVASLRVPGLSWHEVETELAMTLAGPEGDAYSVGVRFPVEWGGHPETDGGAESRTGEPRWTDVREDARFLSRPLAVPRANDGVLTATLVETSGVHGLLDEAAAQL